MGSQEGRMITYTNDDNNGTQRWSGMGLSRPFSRTRTQADSQQVVYLGQVAGTVVLLVVVIKMTVVYPKCPLVQEEEVQSHGTGVRDPNQRWTRRSAN